MPLNHQNILTQKHVESLSAKPKITGKAKVLLIEDDRTMQRLVRSKIGAHCDLLVAGNAGFGADIFRAEDPDIVFVDIGLPDSSGHDLLKWMLSNDPEAFAVMFSGYHDTNNVWKSIEIGAKGFVSKPFDLAKMLFFINQCKK